MKKAVNLLLAAVLALVLLSAPSAQASPEDLYGQTFPDFTVSTINGTSFTLSESLKTHDLVLINFWATWCGPCCMEFPCLETAWEQYGSRVDVIALSIEETDTFDTLKAFAKDNGLKFSIGRDVNRLFESMEGYAIPTTLIVDKNMRVVAVEIGMKSSPEEFTGLFDSLLGATAEISFGESSSQRLREFYVHPLPGVSAGFRNGK